MAFAIGDRVELTRDQNKVLKKGRQGRLMSFPSARPEARRLAYVKFDRYTGGLVSVNLDDLEKV